MNLFDRRSSADETTPANDTASANEPSPTNRPAPDRQPAPDGADATAAYRLPTPARNTASNPPASPSEPSDAGRGRVDDRHAGGGRVDSSRTGDRVVAVSQSARDRSDVSKPVPDTDATRRTPTPGKTVPAGTDTRDQQASPRGTATADAAERGSADVSKARAGVSKPAVTRDGREGGPTAADAPGVEEFATPGTPSADGHAGSGARTGTATGAGSSTGTGTVGTAGTPGTEPSGDWRQVLMEFVDHPREAVEKADRLVDDAVRSLTERINREHSGLRDAWHTHGEPSTEDLRKALRGYRDFFEKVLSSSR